MTKNDDFSELMATITKQHGAGSIMMLGGKSFVPIDTISTSCIGLDIAIGPGGVPRGRVIEIFGPESGGKTTLALHIIAQAQKLGEHCAIVDAEHALDSAYAEKLGVDIKHLLVAQPSCGEEGLEIVESLIQSGKISVVLVDSVAALTPRAEIEGDFGSPQMGLQARLMSQALRKLTAIVHKTNTLLIFINQIREKIGVMFGSPETTTGGRALKFYASVRLDVRKTQTIKDGDVAIGTETRVKVVKNKVSAPFKEAILRLYYGTGFSREADLLTVGTDKGIIEKSGAWYAYQGEKLGQGFEKTRLELVAHPELADKIETELREILFPAKKG